MIHFVLDLWKRKGLSGNGKKGFSQGLQRTSLFQGRRDLAGAIEAHEFPSSGAAQNAERRVFQAYCPLHRRKVSFLLF